MCATVTRTRDDLLQDNCSSQLALVIFYILHVAPGEAAKGMIPY
jgi:hypothetical protein